MIVRRTLKICWISVAAVVVALAVALSAARLLLPGMSEYRAQIEALAERMFESPVKIGSLDAAWHGLSPVLQLNDVHVEDPRLPGGELAISEVQVALDIIDSIAYGKWRTAGIKLIGTEFELHTDLRNPQHPINLQIVFDWLMQQDSIFLEQVQLRWHDPGLFEAPVRFSGLSAQLRNQGRRHQLVVESQLPRSLGRTVKVAADLRGGKHNLAAWNGKVYVKTDALQLAGLRPALAGAALSADGSLDLELWMGVDKARPVWGAGSLQWDEPGLHNTSADAQGVSADSLSSRFHWREWKGGWQVGIEDFELVRNDKTIWPQSRFDVEISTGEGLEIQGEAGLLVLEELNGVMPLVPWIDDNALAMVDRIQPRGLMRDAEFEFRYAQGQQPKFALRAAVEDLKLAANGGLPGARGLSGFIEGNLQAGTLQLDTQEGELVLPRIFPDQPLALSRIDGEIRWQRYKKAFRVESDRLQIASGPLSIDSRWRMDWAYDQAAPWLDIRLAAGDLALESVSDYLPRGVMSPRAVGWLQSAFKAGMARDVEVLLQGRVDQMPFDQGQGRFEARFNFDDVVLDYHPTWGQLDELHGYAVFVGRSMQIVGYSAELLDSPVERVVAEISDLKQPLLTIDGTVGGTLAGMLEYVRVSPLKGKFGALVEQLNASGDAQLQLKLVIPLKKHLGTVKVSGDVAFDGNDLQAKGHEIGLDDIYGNLHFTHKGLEVKQARARLLNRPVKVKVYQRGEAGKASSIVDIQGNLMLVKLLKDKGFPLMTYFDGSASWNVLLEIQAQAAADVPRVTLKLLSDLEGVGIALPEPLAKSVDEKRSLSVAWAPGNETRYPMRISYGDLLKAAVELKARNQGVRRAGLRFGGGKAELPVGREFSISGNIERFDLDDWLPVFKATAKGDRNTLKPSISLTAGAFRFAGFEAHSISASSKAVDPFYFHVDGDDAKGWVRWVGAGPSWAARLLLNMEHLNLTRVQNAAQAHAQPRGVRAVEFPELDVEVGALTWDDRNLGEVKVVTKRVPAGTRFEALNVNAPAIVFNGQGEWLEQGGQESSRFNVNVSGGSLEELTQLLGTGSSVDGGELKGDLQMGWPGAPVDFKLASLEGEINLKAKDGRLTSVDEGPGKLLSLFSLNSLQRRLNLDFRDVVKEGFSFDKLTGRFVVMDGDAFTNNFTIDGTSVRIEISGRTGLISKDYDQLVTVTPQVTSTLPIAGAIAGGPAVGAAVFLADKLVGDQFNRLTQVQYQVSGSWDEPVYTRLKKERKQVPDAGVDTDED